MSICACYRPILCLESARLDAHTMSSSIASPKSHPGSGGSSTASRMTVSLSSILAFIGCAVVLVMLFGHCAGEEFSSQDFSRRSFYYFRLPLIKFQVTPIFRSGKSSVLVKHLHGTNLIPSATQNWELARLDTGVGQPYEADELILCRYLDQRNSDYDLRWLVWTRKNPALARAFWPVVWRVANEDLYLLIPDLFHLARYATDPIQLDSDLRALVVNESARITAAEYQLGHYDPGGPSRRVCLGNCWGQAVMANKYRRIRRIGDAAAGPSSPAEREVGPQRCTSSLRSRGRLSPRRRSCQAKVKIPQKITRPTILQTPVTVRLP